jgi:hypothetical protein
MHSRKLQNNPYISTTEAGKESKQKKRRNKKIRKEEADLKTNNQHAQNQIPKGEDENYTISSEGDFEDEQTERE